jgi:hypothetical protein
MAIAKLLHEGETIRQLKNTIKYNTVAKEHLNSIDNPRLLQAISNLGVIDVSNSASYQDFMHEFINEITLNQSLSTNKRQTKLFAHEMVSFEDKDHARYNQEELAQISVELLSNLYDMDNTPYVIWPQTDSGRLHFHFVRSMYSSNGSYQRVKNSKIKLRQSCEKIELKYNLTPTGKNVSDEIRQVNDPMLKVMKNRKLETEHKHQKKLIQAINQDTIRTKIKRKFFNLLMDGKYQSAAELEVYKANQEEEQNLIERTQVNQKLEAIKKTIFMLYKSAKDEADFIAHIKQQSIDIEILKHTKSGMNKGIVFHYQGQSISGGKISSSMTLGKIKNRFPNFVHTLEQPPSLHTTHRLKRKMLDFQIEKINKYYTQRTNKINDDILIYFGKKNVEARPYNYNLKLSSTRDSIRFGPSTPNDHDLTLSINIALENGWQGATLTSSNPEFLKRMMKVAYQINPDLLFFIKPDKPNQLPYSALKEIKSNLTIDELKTVLTNQLIAENDISTIHQDLIKLLKLNTNSLCDQGYALALEGGFKFEELEQKTTDELQHFYRYQTFHSPANKPIAINEKSSASLNEHDELKTYLKAAQIEAKNKPKRTARNDLNNRGQYKP